MSVVYLSLGSNSSPEDNMRLGVTELRRRFDVWSVSHVYRNKAVGFDGDDFLNAVACIETSLTPQDVWTELEEIHALAGRVRSTTGFVSRTLDIDLLLYDDLILNEAPLRLPRDDVLEYSFVLGPLTEIAPDYVHPLTGKSLKEHWAAFDQHAHTLQKVLLIL